MFRGIPSSHCRFVPKHLQVALALSHQARDGLEAVPEGMRITVCHGAGKEGFRLSSLFSHLFFKIKSPRCLLWGLLVSCVGAAVPEHRAGAVRLQPTSQGGKTLRNSSLAGSVRFCNGSRPDPGAGESGLTPKPGWAGAGVTHGDAAARGHPCPFVPCFGVGPSLFRGLDNPKNQRCRRERAGSETGPGVSEGG